MNIERTVTCPDCHVDVRVAPGTGEGVYCPGCGKLLIEGYQ